MPIIISSEIVEDRIQIDGRRQIRERHTESDGLSHDVVYMAEADVDVDAEMSARVPVLETQLTEAELQANQAEVEGEE